MDDSEFIGSKLADAVVKAVASAMKVVDALDELFQLIELGSPCVKLPEEFAQLSVEFAPSPDERESVVRKLMDAVTQLEIDSSPDHVQRSLRRLYHPHSVKSVGNGFEPYQHDSYTNAVHHFAWRVLMLMPWKEAGQDNELDYAALFEGSRWAMLAERSFSTAEIRAQIGREFRAVIDLLFDQESNGNNGGDGYSRPRTKCEWLLILSKLGEEMGEDKFLALRRTGRLTEHPATQSTKFARSIRLKLSDLPPGYSDDLTP